MKAIDNSSMLNKCFNGRKFSPLTGLLLLALLFYSASLFKRIKEQREEPFKSRVKRSEMSDLASFFNLESDLEDQIGLYIITPTYPRPEQLPELTRLSQTLMVRLHQF